jgi:biopolymer transport protein ExbD
MIFPKRNVVDDEMDMTPMVDIVFELLIFFMVTASFSLQKSLEVPPMDPEDEAAETQTVSQPQEEDDNTVIVRIDEDNIYWLSAAIWNEEKEAPSVQEMLVRLREARQSRQGGTPPSKLLVMASPDSIHEKVIAALDAGSEVGMEEVQLSTDHGE